MIGVTLTEKIDKVFNLEDFRWRGAESFQSTLKHAHHQEPFSPL